MIEENIKVITRVRPFLTGEVKTPGAQPAVTLVNDNTIKFIDSINCSTKQFRSSVAYDGKVNNAEFFDISDIKSLADSAMSGYRYNATVMCD